MPVVPLLGGFSTVPKTRLGLSGYSRMPFGSFAGKPQDIGEEITIRTRTPYEVYIQRHNNPWERTQIVFTGKTFPIVPPFDDG